jgi:hypothetical protein
MLFVAVASAIALGMVIVTRGTLGEALSAGKPTIGVERTAAQEAISQ